MGDVSLELEVFSYCGIFPQDHKVSLYKLSDSFEVNIFLKQSHRLSRYKDFEIEKLVSHVQLCVTPGTVACQAPLSMEFSRQEYWSG